MRDANEFMSRGLSPAQRDAGLRFGQHDPWPNTPWAHEQAEGTTVQIIWAIGLALLALAFTIGCFALEVVK